MALNFAAHLIIRGLCSRKERDFTCARSQLLGVAAFAAACASENESHRFSASRLHEFALRNILRRAGKLQLACLRTFNRKLSGSPIEAGIAQ